MSLGKDIVEMKTENKWGSGFLKNLSQDLKNALTDQNSFSLTKTGRMCETLREPVNVLKSLSEKASNKQYKFQRLYRNLYNPEFYFLAYKNISQSQGSMTAGVDGKSLDGMSERRINALIESLKDFSYQPNPARRVYIDKKNSTKKRPLGIPSYVQQLKESLLNGEQMKMEMSEQFSNIRNWSDMYDTCDMETKKMILSRIFSEVRVRRDY